MELEKYWETRRTATVTPPDVILDFAVQPALWCGVVTFLLAATVCASAPHVPAQWVVLVGGVALTLLAGWTWIRINGTFMNFMRDVQKFG